ncbi:helix-turn-helix domain-containing protein [Aquirufa ecclesiirivi]|uniref:AlbA family DNA-binding domain-containing protein n=1 Tax=Aquirufa ecclesiirivi TaxID=2715124 RepID=UPI0023D7BAB2|nr:ATP-binding protein [Aquirufa ecclesiirivi]MDF0694776.1 ATP-binding protein [Aquirufa ecclesiirivi]
MKYSNIIFNKDLYDLTISDIEHFFKTEREETLNLEFKSYVDEGDYSKKEDVIIKTACALLNSEGGVIIWGAPLEEKNTDGNTTAKGELTAFNSPLDRDRLVNKITSRIIPLPIGIRVQKIKNLNDKSIFIIEVEKSLDRPHQFENKYFVRLDGQTRIAPHYLISALMKSVSFPNLRGHLKLKSITQNNLSISLNFKKLLYNSTPLLNDVNVMMRLICTPGDIIIDNNKYNGEYQFKIHPIISTGAPLMSNFSLRILKEKINQDITILFQFGGEKSPAKVSSYIFKINDLEDLHLFDESKYLFEKSENKLPSDISNLTVDQRIEILLNS